MCSLRRLFATIPTRIRLVSHRKKINCTKTTNILILQLNHIWPRILRALRHQLDGVRDDPLSLVDLTISEPNRQKIAPESAKKHMPLPISIPSAPVTVDSHLSTSSDPPLSYTTYPEEDRVMSPYLVPSFNPSCESLPLSPGPEM